MFGRSKKSESEIRSPLVQYVNLLLMYLLKKEPCTAVLQNSEPLPELELGREAEGVTFDRVYNRLKVLADLAPMKYPEPTEGVIETVKQEEWYRFECVFHDSAEDRYCEIRVKKTGETIYNKGPH